MVTWVSERLGKKLAQTLAQTLAAKSKSKRPESSSSGATDAAEPSQSTKTGEELEKAVDAALKPQLQMCLKTLLHAVKPLCDNTYTAAPHTDVLTAKSDTEWLRSIDKKLDVLAAVPNQPQLRPQPSYQHVSNTPTGRPPHNSSASTPIGNLRLPPAKSPAPPSINTKHVDSIIPNFIAADEQE